MSLRSWLLSPVSWLASAGAAGVAATQPPLPPAWPPRLWALAVVLAYGALCLRFLRRSRRGPAEAPAGGGDAALVAFASQTGTAEALAQLTADALAAGGRAVALLPLDRLRPADLQRHRLALFVASTTGEGDPPDSAGAFIRRVMRDGADLPHLSFGLLALGDRGYRNFCGFGRALELWLLERGATPLFDRVEVDRAEPAALRAWQHQIRTLSGAETPDWSRPAYGTWRLVRRTLLNPGSPGAPVYHLVLQPLGSAVGWRAGDIAEVAPRNGTTVIAAFLDDLRLDPEAPVALDGAEQPLRQALADRLLTGGPAEREALRGLPAERLVERLRPLSHREYSLASLPSQDAAELLVRRRILPGGGCGVGSAWLTEVAPLGGGIALRLRSNPAFHGPADDRPMILVGAGTGLAGLRAHLAERIAAGRRRNWLVFGERTSVHDWFFREEIEGWRATGGLERLDLAFSRDGGSPVYVQHRLAAEAPRLRRWVQEGAAVYVCGDRRRMAAAVHAVLAEALGEAVLEGLVEEGRYRRDVY